MSFELNPEIEQVAYSIFKELPLKEKCVILSKFVNTNDFKVVDNDIFGLNKKIVSSIYKRFIDNIREKLDDRPHKNKQKAKNSQY